MFSNDTNNQSRNTVKKLHLKKETIKVLQSSELKQVAGGKGTNTAIQGCCIPHETETCPSYCGQCDTVIACTENCLPWTF